MRVYARQRDTVDAICYRELGRTGDITESVLEANPGIAALGPMLPHGTPLDLPDAPAQTTETDVIQLWD